MKYSIAVALVVLLAGCGGGGGGQSTSSDKLPPMAAGQVFRYSSSSTIPYGYQLKEIRITGQTGKDPQGSSYRIVEWVDDYNVQQIFLSQQANGSIFRHGGAAYGETSYVTSSGGKHLWAPSPLYVGAAGRCNYEYGWQVRGEWRITAKTAVTVPAGTFDCYEVHSTMTFNGNTVETIDYYSPLYPFFIKEVTDGGYVTFELESVE